MKIDFKKATLEDCDEIHKMQVISFKELYNKYKDKETNPAAEPIERVIHRMQQDITDYYFICINFCKIGVITIVHLPNNIYRISRIFILPVFQGKGYAQEAIIKVETLYPKANGWELDTIKQEDKLCHLYEKMGYKKTEKEENIKEGMDIVFYAK